MPVVLQAKSILARGSLDPAIGDVWRDFVTAIRACVAANPPGTIAPARDALEAWDRHDASHCDHDPCPDRPARGRGPAE